MASTDIAALAVKRTVTTEYLAAEIPTISQLLASGAVTVDTTPPYKNAGGETFNVPEVLEFTTAAGVIPDDDTEATLNSMSTSYDVGVVCRRENNISVKDTANIVAGQDLNTEATRQAPQVFAKTITTSLYNTVKGVFASAFSSSNFVYNVGGTFGFNIIPEIMKMGAVKDQWPLFRVFIMNGVTFAQAYQNGIVSYVDAGSFGERLLTTGQIPTIAGKQVVVDDTIVEENTVYLCKPNALYLGFQRDFVVETARDAGKGGGMWKHYFRAHYVPHVRRALYGGAVNPTDATLATAGSWTASTAASTDPKLVGIIKIVHL